MPSIDDAFSKVSFGEIGAGVVAAAFPSIKGSFVVLRAADTNPGVIYLGLAGVTIPNGATDTTSGWPLPAGSETLAIPLPSNDLASLSIIASIAGCSLSYMVFS
jgi:hypothetical protein